MRMMIEPQVFLGGQLMSMPGHRYQIHLDRSSSAWLHVHAKNGPDWIQLGFSDLVRVDREILSAQVQLDVNGQRCGVRPVPLFLDTTWPWPWWGRIGVFWRSDNDQLEPALLALRVLSVEDLEELDAREYPACRHRPNTKILYLAPCEECEAAR